MMSDFGRDTVAFTDDNNARKIQSGIVDGGEAAVN